MQLTVNKTNEDQYLIPPDHIAFPGGGGSEADNLKKVADNFLQYFLKYGNIKPDYKILEIGCGTGRMPIALTKFLSNQGEYHGFDIVKSRIEWCQEAYKVKHPNFNFQVADIYNKNYNPEGKVLASEYKFPYEDNYFDFIFLTSVFTHMFAPDIQNYLSEIHRILKKDRRCMITWFVLNTESLTNIICCDNIHKLNKFKFKIDFGLTSNKDRPEVAVAFYESFIRRIYAEAKLEISNPILYGSWCKRQNFVSHQDIIIAEKK